MCCIIHTCQKMNDDLSHHTHTPHERSCGYLMVEDQLGSSVSRRVLAQQGPRVGVDVVAVEVALQGFAVAHAGVQVAAQRVDLPPLGVDAHLVAGPSAWATLSRGRDVTFATQIPHT